MPRNVLNIYRLLVLYVSIWVLTVEKLVMTNLYLLPGTSTAWTSRERILGAPLQTSLITLKYFTPMSASVLLSAETRPRGRPRNRTPWLEH